MSWDISKIEKWTWKEHPPGGVIKAPGNSKQFKTGGWRTLRPIRDEETCNQCLICYVYCPDSAILTEGEQISSFDLDFCKGCGICAEECPKNAIEMVDESKAQDSVD